MSTLQSCITEVVLILTASWPPFPKLTLKEGSTRESFVRPSFFTMQNWPNVVLTFVTLCCPLLPTKLTLLTWLQVWISPEDICVFTSFRTVFSVNSWMLAMQFWIWRLSGFWHSGERTYSLLTYFVLFSKILHPKFSNNKKNIKKNLILFFLFSTIFFRINFIFLKMRFLSNNSICPKILIWLMRSKL